MSNKINSNQSCDWLKEKMLEYCGVDARIKLLDMSYPETPKIDINIDLNDSISSINISKLKGGIINECYVEVNGIIDIKDIISMMDYLVNDHKLIDKFDLKKDSLIQGESRTYESVNKLYMNFNINLSNNSLEKECLLVRDIHLNITFNKTNNLIKNYTHEILNHYNKNLCEDLFFSMRFGYVRRNENNYTNKEEFLKFMRYASSEAIIDDYIEQKQYELKISE